MAAIERLINRKVESRTVEGFHPGSAAPRVAQQQPSRNNVRRHPRAEFQPRGNGQRRGSGQHRGNGQHWGNGQSRGNGQPSRDGQRRPERAPTASARDDQLREARARMAAEGEKLPQRSHRPPARSSRQQRWDPRRSEPQEPAYAHPGKPAPSRPAPVIQRKRSFAGMVGALLGRKTETEE